MISKKTIMLLCLVSIYSNYSISQTDSVKIAKAKYITNSVTLDGILDDEEWKNAEEYGDFWQFFPKDSVKAEYQTSFKVMYDDHNIYFGVKAVTSTNNYVVTTLRRDFAGTTNDNITFLFDTYNDGNIGYALGITPYGVQRDVLVSLGGASADGFNPNWDIKWKAESKIYDQYYTVEVVLPLTSIKFKEGETKWRFRPYRWNIQNNEQSTWARIPQTQLFASLAYMGELHFEKPLGKSRTPVSIIPFINGLTQKDHIRNTGDSKMTTGLDGKVAIGDGLNLDLTINPDFSNVEVDEIFTNLTRFEVFLPERRQFFIDNSDLFASFGNYFNEAKPFFSRRIGLARNNEGNLVENNITGGLRLSGKLDENWRLGILNVQTSRDEENGIFGNNNGMLAIQRKIGKASNIGAFVVNRNAMGESLANESNKYNRVFGIDYNLSANKNIWNGRFYIHKSIQPGNHLGNYSGQATITYNKNNFVVTNDFVGVDKEFQADLGFVPRKDILKSGHGITKYFITKKWEKLSRQSARLVWVNYCSPSRNFKYTDYFGFAQWQAEFKNSSIVNTNIRRDFIFLTNAFDPTRTPGGLPLPGNTSYYFNSFNAEYISTPTKILTYRLSTSLGQFFIGNKYSATAQMGYRIQPKISMSLIINYDNIQMPNPYPSAQYFLITPRIDVTFSKTIFWSALMQYSNQRNNMGFNSRLQWRFAPLSDLFLVYNDNYLIENWGPKFRSLNLKITYWLNM